MELMAIASTVMAAQAETIFREYLDLVGVRDGAPVGVRWANLTLALPHVIHRTGYLDLVEVEERTEWRTFDFPEAGLWLIPSRSELNTGRGLSFSGWPVPAAEHMVAVQAAVEVLVRKEADGKRRAMAEDDANGTVQAPSRTPDIAIVDEGPVVCARSILEEALDIRRGARNAAYGDARIEMEKLAAAWNALFPDGGLFTSARASLFLAVVKLVRESHRHGRDNLVDLAGYADIAAVCAESGVGS
jgi:hypothetical protein